MKADEILATRWIKLIIWFRHILNIDAYEWITYCAIYNACKFSGFYGQGIDVISEMTGLHSRTAITNHLTSLMAKNLIYKTKANNSNTNNYYCVELEVLKYLDDNEIFKEKVKFIKKEKTLIRKIIFSNISLEEKIENIKKTLQSVKSLENREL